MDDGNRSIGKTIAKTAFGAMFLVVAFVPDEEFELGPRLMGVVIGLALVLWGVLPYVMDWYNEKKEREEEARAEEKARMAELQCTESAVWKCPNCGGIAHGKTCEYCGMPYEGEQ